MPYTYLVGWSSLGLWYYGVRYARGCSPEDLWVSYFTSSLEVKRMRSEHGEPDVVETRRTFSCGEAAREWEDRVLRRLGAVRSNQWINASNGGKEFNASSAAVRQRVADANRGKKRTDEAKTKMSMAALGRPQTEETRKRRSASLVGHKLSEKSKDKLRTPKSEETRKRMSEAAKTRNTASRFPRVAALINKPHPLNTP